MWGKRAYGGVQEKAGGLDPACHVLCSALSDASHAGLSVSLTVIHPHLLPSLQLTPEGGQGLL